MFGRFRLFTRIHEYLFEKTYKAPERIPEKKSIIWPVYQNQASHSIRHFISYEQDIFGHQKNSRNVLFVVGGPGSGKSWLLKSACKQSIIIDNQHQCLANFAHSLKTELIKVIEEQHLSLEIIRKALDYTVETTQPKLQPITSLSDEFWQSDIQETQQTQNSISSIQDALNQIQEEYRYKIPSYKWKEEDGIQPQIDFLFKLLNYTAGFLDDNLKLRQQCEIKQQLSIVILGIDKLFDYYRHDTEAQDFIDHLCLSLYNATGIRNHIPIVVESSDSLQLQISLRFYHRHMAEMMRVDLENILAIDVIDPIEPEIMGQVEGVFEKYIFILNPDYRSQVQQIYQVIGGNLQDWHEITKSEVSEREFDWQQWLNDRQQNTSKLVYLLNQVKVSPRCAALLDNNKIDTELHKILTAIEHYNGEVIKQCNQIHTGNYFADALIFHNDVVLSLLQEGVLHHPRHISTLQYSRRSFQNQAKQLISDKNYFPILHKYSVLFEKLSDKSWLKKRSLLVNVKRRGQFHWLDSPEPRKFEQSDQDNVRKPYHEFYI